MADMTPRDEQTSSDPERLRVLYSDLQALHEHVIRLERAGESMGTIPQLVQSMMDELGAAIKRAAH